MRTQLVGACAALLMGLVGSPARLAAQEAMSPDTTMASAATPALASAGANSTEVPVVQNDLSGPRIGATVLPNGLGVRSQFGWHFENQASSGSQGPWFIVERIFLIGGVERSEFFPSGTLIFGFRTPTGFEFGVGPSLTLGGMQGASSAVVVAAGQTLRYGGIRVPVNLAVAMNKDTYRVTLITGWAIRDTAPKRPRGYYSYDRRGFYGGPGD